jgi:lipopolysaccharide export system permease protein
VIIQRYIISEIIRPAAAILFLLVVIFASYCAVTYLSDAVAGLLPPGTVLVLILYKIAMALEVLLPVTFFLAVVIALGRMYMDSEMTALRASGFGLGRVLAPVFLLALPVGVLAGCASLYLRPEAYAGIYRIKAQSKSQFDLTRLEAGQFLELEGGKYVFFAESVREKEPGAQQAFIRAAQGENRQVILARKMDQDGSDAGPRKLLLFRDGVLVEFPRRGPGGKQTRFERAEYPLAESADSNSRYQRKAAATGDLIGSTRLEDIAELQWRWSTPLSTLLLALLGVPLSKSNPRQGKFAKMGAAVILFAFYYQLFVVAKTWVEKGAVPPLPGIWWVPALLVAVILFLLWRSGEVFYRRAR